MGINVCKQSRRAFMWINESEIDATAGRRWGGGTPIKQTYTHTHTHEKGRVNRRKRSSHCHVNWDKYRARFWFKLNAQRKQREEAIWIGMNLWVIRTQACDRIKGVRESGDLVLRSIDPPWMNVIISKCFYSYDSHCTLQLLACIIQEEKCRERERERKEWWLMIRARMCVHVRVNIFTWASFHALF